MNDCNCSETFLARFNDKGEQIEPLHVSPLKGHDCRYIQRRNTLIPQAEETALNTDGVIKWVDGKEKVNGRKFTRVFAREMQRLSDLQESACAH